MTCGLRALSAITPVSTFMQAAGSSTAPPALTEGTLRLTRMQDKEIGFRIAPRVQANIRVAIDALPLCIKTTH